MAGVHPSASVEDAMTQLDTRIPLLHSERKLIVQSLWDAAFREGARQGRQAGYEAAQADALDILDREPRGEYQDPTQAVRERLAQLKRK